MTERERWIEEQVELIGTALPKLEAAQMLRDAMAFADSTPPPAREGVGDAVREAAENTFHWASKASWKQGQAGPDCYTTFGKYPDEHKDCPLCTALRNTPPRGRVVVDETLAVRDIWKGNKWQELSARATFELLATDTVRVIVVEA